MIRGSLKRFNSISYLAFRPRSSSPGFGPVYVDGLGSNYNCANNFFTASVTARNQCKTTNANAFKDQLLKSLQDVRKTFDEAKTKEAKL